MEHILLNIEDNVRYMKRNKKKYHNRNIKKEVRQKTNYFNVDENYLDKIERKNKKINEKDIIDNYFNDLEYEKREIEIKKRKRKLNVLKGEDLEWIKDSDIISNNLEIKESRKVIVLENNIVINNNSIDLRYNRLIDYINENIYYKIRIIFYGELYGISIEKVCNLPPFLTDSCNVLTSSGYINVRFLNKGDSILTSDNRVVEIKEILRIRLENNKSLKMNCIPVDYYDNNLPMIKTYLSDNYVYNNLTEWTSSEKENIGIEWRGKEIELYSIELPNFNRDNLVINGLTMLSWNRIH